MDLFAEIYQGYYHNEDQQKERHVGHGIERDGKIPVFGAFQFH
jgi:hypothetical protein